VSRFDLQFTLFHFWHSDSKATADDFAQVPIIAEAYMDLASESRALRERVDEFAEI
jgi:hypothetical protein